MDFNPPSPFDDELEPTIDRLDYGDLYGEDEALKGFINSLNENIEESAPNHAPAKKLDLMNLVLEGNLSPIKWACKSYEFIRDRFTNYEIRQATANKINSEANLNNAKADAIERLSKAKAETITLKAKPASQPEENQVSVIDPPPPVKKSDLIKEQLIARGLDWATKQTQNEDGKLVIVVVQNDEHVTDNAPKTLEQLEENSPKEKKKKKGKKNKRD